MGVFILFIIESGTKPFGMICHPKTASQACRQALVKQLGARSVDGQHYLNEEECQKILDNGGMLLSTVRNPWLVSDNEKNILILDSL